MGTGILRRSFIRRLVVPEFAVGLLAMANGALIDRPCMPLEPDGLLVVAASVAVGVTAWGEPWQAAQ